MSDNKNQKSPLLSNKAYDNVKRFVELVLPAFATLYFTMANIWGLPNAENVVASAAAVATFLGVILRISSRSYNASDSKYDGVINISFPKPDSTLYSLDLNVAPETIVDKSEMVFKVNPNQ